MGDHVHLKSLGSFGYLRADITQTDDAQYLISEFRANQFVSLPFT